MLRIKPSGIDPGRCMDRFPQIDCQLLMVKQLVQGDRVIACACLNQDYDYEQDYDYDYESTAPTELPCALFLLVGELPPAAFSERWICSGR